MPGPPTPVSGCPLQRLEIRDSLTSRVFDSSRSFSALTFTLEGQRPSGSESSSLVLLIHLGVQRVLTIRLTELLKLPKGPAETVSIDRSTQQLCIKVPEHNQTVLSWFEESRDFNVTVCMLQKSGFHSKDIFPQGFSQPTVQRHRSSSLTFEVGNNFAPAAPRLSSITPLPGLDTLPSCPTQDSLSFTSMLNNGPIPLQLTSPSYSARHAPASAQDLNMIVPFSENGQQAIFSAPLPLIDSQLNPYNVFLNKQNNDFNRPRVSSPLRNSFRPGWQSEPVPSRAFPRVMSPVHTELLKNEPFCTTYESASPQSPFPIDQVTDTPSSSNSWASPQDRASASTLPSPTVPQGRSISNPSQTFRDIMPQRRDLPFIRRQDSGKRKRSTADIEHFGDEAAELTDVSPARGKKQKAFTKRHGDDDVPQEALGQSKNAHSAVDKSTAMAQAGSQSNDTTPQSLVPSRTTESMPAVYVVDPPLLEKINQQTSRLFEQYEADVAQGCDESAYALFYMDQIQTARRDFWLEHLGYAECRSGTATV